MVADDSNFAFYFLSAFTSLIYFGIVCLFLTQDQTPEFQHEIIRNTNGPFGQNIKEFNDDNSLFQRFR